MTDTYTSVDSDAQYTLDSVLYVHHDERNDMSRGTPHRTIRIPDELWTAAQLRANRDHTTLSDVIRNMLERYTAIGREEK